MKRLEAVEKLPQPDFDARSMKSSILYQMGKLEESEKLTQRCLYEEIRNAGLSLVSLAKIAGEESEYERRFDFWMPHRSWRPYLKKAVSEESMLWYPR